MSTAPGVCVCVPTAPSVCVCVCAHCSRCVHTWMGQMQRTNFTAGYTLYNYVCDKKIKNSKPFFFFSKPIMVKCLNIGKNIGKPIYRSISTVRLYVSKTIFPVLSAITVLTAHALITSS